MPLVVLGVVGVFPLGVVGVFPTVKAAKQYINILKYCVISNSKYERHLFVI